MGIVSSDDKVVGRQDDLPLNAVLSSDLALSISDALRDDDPLVWVNAAFTRLTGYPAEEILGRNCRFLQGAETDPVAVARIRDRPRPAAGGGDGRPQLPARRHARSGTRW